MNFLSLHFFIFFLIVAVLYYSTLFFNSYIQQILLLVASIYFYIFSSIKFLPFLIFSFAVTYTFSFLVKKGRIFLLIALIIDIFPLIFFKYINFYFSLLFDTKYNLILPLGISFITFQSLSYLIDIYNNKTCVEKNPITVCLYISFFPTVSSGPIQRAENFIPQIKTIHLFNYEKVTSGMKLFTWGAFKKILISNSLATYIDLVYNTPSEKHGCALLLATIFYSFQIYCDFSGYSDMAIGISNFFGFDIPRNFDHPYLSKSCSEFWKRWHISLSTWLKDYIYIPLGGSRISSIKTYINLIIVFLVSGLWHGATWTFIVWGLLHGLYQCIGRLLNKHNKDKPASLKIIETFILITFSWIFFRSNNISDSTIIIKKILLIPLDICNFIRENPEMYLRDSIKQLFMITGEIKNIRGMMIMVLKIFFVICTEILTYNHSGLDILGKQPVILRWVLYFLTIYFLEIALFDSNIAGLSTNFIYTHF